MATLVKFKDTIENDSEIHFGILLDDGDVICMCCGGTVENGDYEIVQEFSQDMWYYADNTLLNEFELI